MSDSINIATRYTSDGEQWRWTCNRCWSRGKWTSQSPSAALESGYRHQLRWHR